MTPIFYRVSHKVRFCPPKWNIISIQYQLRDGIAKQVVDDTHGIDILNWMTRAALELVGQGGLGWSFDTLEKPEVNTLAEYIKAFVWVVTRVTQLIVLTCKVWSPTIGPLFLFMRFVPALTRMGTPTFFRWVLDHLPWRRVQMALKISDAIYGTATEVLKSKRAALVAGDKAVAAQIGGGKDIISVLCKQTILIRHSLISKLRHSKEPDVGKWGR